MKQIEKDAIIMRQVWERIIEIMHDNGVLYNRDNIRRLAQILMAMSVNMIGMSSNNVAEFRKHAQKLVDNMVGVLDTMPADQRNELMSSIDKQLDWFDEQYKSNDEEEQVDEPSENKSKMN